MDAKRHMLKHFLAAIAYRAQKALRDAPDGFADFSLGRGVRTPAQLVRHITGVLGYARTFFIGGLWRPEPLPTFDDEIKRMHEIIESLGKHLDDGTEFINLTPEQMLQGQFADAMTHIGQLAMLRRLYGSPVPPENFIYAKIDPSNLDPDQPDPAAPDEDWNADGTGRV